MKSCSKWIGLVGQVGVLALFSAQAMADDCRETVYRPVRGQIFQVNPETATLPDFNTLDSIGQICLFNIDVADRDYQEGFPGVPQLKEWFALDLQSRLIILEPGIYTFKLTSDDGSRLWIDGKELVDNDGVHAERDVIAEVFLSPGIHPVRVAYFQGPRERIALQLSWITPAIFDFEIVPTSSFAPGGIPNLPFPD